MGHYYSSDLTVGETDLFCSTQSGPFYGFGQMYK